jgi:hypothetical protein
LEEEVNLDLIDYTVMSYNKGLNEVDSNEVKTYLLAYLSGRTSSDTGDICQVLAAKQSNENSKNRKAHESSTAPSSVQVYDVNYYLNKGETITFQGHQYSTHIRLFRYRIGQHNFVHDNKSLVDCGANGGIVGDGMLVLEVNGLLM